MTVPVFLRRVHLRNTQIGGAGGESDDEIEFLGRAVTTAEASIVGGEAGPRMDEKRVFQALLAVALVYLAAIALNSMIKGPWIDEYWTVFLADRNVPLEHLFWTRWLPDVSPVPASLIYYSSAALSAASRVSVLRLVLNVPAVFLLILSTALFLRQSRQFRSFYPISAILLLGMVWVTRFGAEYRIYFWLAVVTLVALQYLFWSRWNSRTRTFRLEDGIGGTALFLSLNLHFVATILIAPCYGLLLLDDFRRQGFRAKLWPALFGCAGLLMWLLLAAVQYRQLNTWLDFHWIRASTTDALWIYATTWMKLIVSVGVALAVVAFAAFRSRGPRRSGSAKRANLVAAAIVSISMVFGGIAVLVLNAVQPVIVFRYLIVWAPMMAIITALLLISFPLPRLWLLIICAASVANIVREAQRDSQRLQWRGGLEVARSITAACPNSVLIAAPNWRFGDHGRTKTARRETEVLRMGIRRYAVENGTRVEVLDSYSPVRLDPHNCPILLWIPQILDALPTGNLPQLLRRGNIVLAPGARVSMAADTPDTFMIRIDPRS